MVTVRVFGNLKRTLKVSQLRGDIGREDKTVNYVLNSFMKQFGRSLRHELLDSKGRVKATYSIFVNGRNITLLSGLDTKLKEDDIVMILLLVEGG